MPLDLWTSGPLDLWTSGPLDLWTSGPLDLWTSGPLDLWTSGPIILLLVLFPLAKATSFILSSFTVRSPLAPPHNHGTSPPNCNSFGSGVLMDFMGV